jgi:hypothetical protein
MTSLLKSEVFGSPNEVASYLTTQETTRRFCVTGLRRDFLELQSYFRRLIPRADAALPEHPAIHPATFPHAAHDMAARVAKNPVHRQFRVYLLSPDAFAAYQAHYQASYEAHPIINKDAYIELQPTPAFLGHSHLFIMQSSLENPSARRRQNAGRIAASLRAARHHTQGVENLFSLLRLDGTSGPRFAQMLGVLKFADLYLAHRLVEDRHGSNQDAIIHRLPPLLRMMAYFLKDEPLFIPSTKGWDMRKIREAKGKLPKELLENLGATYSNVINLILALDMSATRFQQTGGGLPGLLDKMPETLAQEIAAGKITFPKADLKADPNNYWVNLQHTAAHHVDDAVWEIGLLRDAVAAQPTHHHIRETITTLSPPVEITGNPAPGQIMHAVRTGTLFTLRRPAGKTPGRTPDRPALSAEHSATVTDIRTHPRSPDFGDTSPC